VSTKFNNVKRRRKGYRKGVHLVDAAAKSKLHIFGTHLIDVFEFFSRGKERREERDKLILFYFQKALSLPKTMPLNGSLWIV
jgi:hypothetical protein